MGEYITSVSVQLARLALDLVQRQTYVDYSCRQKLS